MAIAPTKCTMGTAITALIAVSSSGCAGSLEQQSAALRATQFSSTTRYAVASRNSNMHTVPTFPIGDKVSGRVADVVRNKLGIEAVALSHANGSDWSAELARAHDATGWIMMSGNKDFFLDSGFDGYVLITIYEDIEMYDGPGRHARDRKFFTYDPVYHMFSLPQNQGEILLMQAGVGGRFSCEMVDDRLKDEPGCVDIFVKRFRRALDARLAKPK